jgi:hypothetical protein
MQERDEPGSTWFKHLRGIESCGMREKRSGRVSMLCLFGIYDAPYIIEQAVSSKYIAYSFFTRVRTYEYPVLCITDKHAFGTHEILGPFVKFGTLRERRMRCRKDLQDVAWRGGYHLIPERLSGNRRKVSSL